MPEVYTLANKQRNEKIGRGSGAKHSRKLSTSDIIHIRQMKKEGQSLAKAYALYQNQISKSSFDGIWYNKTYKEIIV